MMNTEKLAKATNACADFIRRQWRGNNIKPVAERLAPGTYASEHTPRVRDGHLLFMCEEIERIVSQARAAARLPQEAALAGDTGALIEARRDAAALREKAMRWLGFVQGALWANNQATIDELKQMNMPDGEAPQ